MHFSYTDNIFNPLLDRIFLDHDIILFFRQHWKNLRKNLNEIMNTFENIMENGAFNGQMLHFP